MHFIREQGVVGLAVGIILGGAVSKFVTAVITDVVAPVLGVLLGSTKGLAGATVTIPGTTAKILWGDLVAKGIDFVVIALVVYFGVIVLKLDKLDKKKDPPVPPKAPVIIAAKETEKKS